MKKKSTRRESLTYRGLLDDPSRSYALALADNHGCWCAWCHEYIQHKGDLEGHHIWPEWALDRILPAHFPRDCRVPVHRSCHRKHLQRYSDTAGTNLVDGTALFTDDRDLTCHASFLEGNLNRVIFLREWNQRLAIKLGDRDSEHHNLIFQINPLAGSALALQLLKQSPPWCLGRPSHKTPVESELLIAAGSVMVNSGHVHSGWERYQAVTGEIPRWRKASNRLYGVIRRRIAIVTCDPSNAEQALKQALEERDRYTIRTALLAAGWAEFKQQDFSSSRDYFDRIHLEVPGPVSWWHRLCQDLGAGCAIYRSKADQSQIPNIAERFVRAQYIQALLGLQGIPIPDPRRGNPNRIPERVHPTDLVVWLCNSYPLLTTPQRMTEVRKRALGFTREELLNVLTRPNERRP